MEGSPDNEYTLWDDDPMEEGTDEQVGASVPMEVEEEEEADAERPAKKQKIGPLCNAHDLPETQKLINAVEGLSSDKCVVCYSDALFLDTTAEAQALFAILPEDVRFYCSLQCTNHRYHPLTRIPMQCGQMPGECTYCAALRNRNRGMGLFPPCDEIQNWLKFDTDVRCQGHKLIPKGPPRERYADGAATGCPFCYALTDLKPSDVKDLTPYFASFRLSNFANFTKAHETDAPHIFSEELVTSSLLRWLVTQGRLALATLSKIGGTCRAAYWFRLRFAEVQDETDIVRIWTEQYMSIFPDHLDLPYYDMDRAMRTAILSDGFMQTFAYVLGNPYNTDHQNTCARTFLSDLARVDVRVLFKLNLRPHLFTGAEIECIRDTQTKVARLGNLLRLRNVDHHRHQHLQWIQSNTDLWSVIVYGSAASLPTDTHTYCDALHQLLLEHVAQFRHSISLSKIHTLAVEKHWSMHSTHADPDQRRFTTDEASYIVNSLSVGYQERVPEKIVGWMGRLVSEKILTYDAFRCEYVLTLITQLGQWIETVMPGGVVVRKSSLLLLRLLGRSVYGPELLDWFFNPSRKSYWNCSTSTARMLEESGMKAYVDAFVSGFGEGYPHLKPAFGPKKVYPSKFATEVYCDMEKIANSLHLVHLAHFNPAASKLNEIAAILSKRQFLDLTDLRMLRVSHFNIIMYVNDRSHEAVFSNFAGALCVLVTNGALRRCDMARIGRVNWNMNVLWKSADPILLKMARRKCNKLINIDTDSAQRRWSKEQTASVIIYDMSFLYLIRWAHDSTKIEYGGKKYGSASIALKRLLRYHVNVVIDNFPRLCDSILKYTETHPLIWQRLEIILSPRHADTQDNYDRYTRLLDCMASYVWKKYKDEPFNVPFDINAIMDVMIRVLGVDAWVQVRDDSLPRLRKHRNNSRISVTHIITCVPRIRRATYAMYIAVCLLLLKEHDTQILTEERFAIMFSVYHLDYSDVIKQVLDTGVHVNVRANNTIALERMLCNLPGDIDLLEWAHKLDTWKGFLQSQYGGAIIGWLEELSVGNILPGVNTSSTLPLLNISGRLPGVRDLIREFIDKEYPLAAYHPTRTYF